MRRFSFLMLAAALCLPMVGCGDEAAKPDAKTPVADGAEDGSDAKEDAASDEKEDAAE